MCRAFIEIFVAFPWTFIHCMENYLYEFSSIGEKKHIPVWIKIKMGKLWQDFKNNSQDQHSKNMYY